MALPLTAGRFEARYRSPFALDADVATCPPRAATGSRSPPRRSAPWSGGGSSDAPAGADPHEVPHRRVRQVSPGEGDPDAREVPLVAVREVQGFVAWAELGLERMQRPEAVMRLHDRAERVEQPVDGCSLPGGVR